MVEGRLGKVGIVRCSWEVGVKISRSGGVGEDLMTMQPLCWANSSLSQRFPHACSSEIIMQKQGD